MSNKILFLAICFFILTIFSCNDGDKTGKPSDVNKDEGFFVINEGTFGLGNASLSYINILDSSKNSDIDLFFNANNRKVGDVFQSMNFINNNLWLVLNNSGKIEVISSTNYKSTATIKGLKSPRYTLEVMPDKVYISDLYSNCISIINSNNFTKTGEIKCNGWTEQMLLADQKVWVTNYNSNFIFIINPITDKISDSLEVAWGGSSIVYDKNGKIWVLCSGDFIKNKKGGLFCFDSKSLKKEKEILFDKTDFNPFKLIQNSKNDSLYFVFKGIYKFSKNINILPDKPFIKENIGSSFYGITTNKSNGKIYVADAKDFNSKGKIHEYSASGDYIKSYRAGIIPSDFLWW
ncbi:MAG: hypothetical protein IT243_05240 [Bacteroidia bacterium]|nr:hypothetical protein [Bacteroidia bacterium]